MQDDNELSVRLSLFMANLINSGDVDNVVIITNRGDRVGLHCNGKGGASTAVAFAMMGKIIENKGEFKEAASTR